MKAKQHLEFVKVDVNSGWERPEGYPPGFWQKILASDLGVAVSLPGQTSRQSAQSSHDTASAATARTGMRSSLMVRKPGGHTATQAPQRVHIS